MRRALRSGRECAAAIEAGGWTSRAWRRYCASDQISVSVPTVSWGSAGTRVLLVLFQTGVDDALNTFSVYRRSQVAPTFFRGLEKVCSRWDLAMC